jgi:hypothetical protein
MRWQFGKYHFDEPIKVNRASLGVIEFSFDSGILDYKVWCLLQPLVRLWYVTTNTIVPIINKWILHRYDYELRTKYLKALYDWKGKRHAKRPFASSGYELVMRESWRAELED